MKPYNFNTQSKQAGMTLIELAVVLMILAGLAGLVVPYVSGYLGRTQDSTTVTSQSDIDSIIQSYIMQKGGSPDFMEALINGATGASTTDTNCNTSATSSTVYCKMMYTGYFLAQTLPAEELQSLQMAGINNLYYNNPNTSNATFASTLAAAPLSATSYVAAVANPSITTWPTMEDYLASVFGTASNKFDNSCYDYLAFGIGNQSALTGSVMSSAPIYFSPQGIAGAVSKYNRFVAIYQVDKIATVVSTYPTATPANGRKGCFAGTEAAKFIGTVVAGLNTPVSGNAAAQLMGMASSQASSAVNASQQ